MNWPNLLRYSVQISWLQYRITGFEFVRTAGLDYTCHLFQVCVGNDVCYDSIQERPSLWFSDGIERDKSVAVNHGATFFNCPSKFFLSDNQTIELGMHILEFCFGTGML